MISYNILDSKKLDGVCYQLIEEKDSTGSRYIIGTPVSTEKHELRWNLLGVWGTKTFIKSIFDNIGNSSSKSSCKNS